MRGAPHACPQYTTLPNSEVYLGIHGHPTEALPFPDMGALQEGGSSTSESPSVGCMTGGMHNMEVCKILAMTEEVAPVKVPVLGGVHYAVSDGGEGRMTHEDDSFLGA